MFSENQMPGFWIKVEHRKSLKGYAIEECHTFDKESKIGIH